MIRVNAAQITQRMKPLLGTFVEIGVQCVCPKTTQKALENAFSAVENIAQQMSFHHPDSALSQLNRSAAKGSDWLTLPPETIEVLQLAKTLSEQTDNLFNCTVAGYLVARHKLPCHFPHRFLLSGNAGDFEIKNHQARLLKPILITLDGIAKGYAVDKGIEALINTNVDAGWINAGGDLRVFGDLKLPIWRRQIAEQAHHLTVTPTLLHNKAFASSQVLRHSGQSLPSHIINTAGTEANNCLISVEASEAWLADGLTKVLALLPESQRAAMAQRFNAFYRPHPETPQPYSEAYG